MRIITLFIVFLTLFGCVEKDSSGIELFNGITFDLTENEKEISISKTVELQYHKPDSIHNIPLFKYVMGEDYQIYIGIPIRTSVDKYYAAKKAEADSAFNAIKTDDSYYNYQKVDSIYVVEMLIEKEQNTFFIKGQTSNEGLLKTVLSDQNILKRFTQ